MTARRHRPPQLIRGCWVAAAALMIATVTGCDSGTDDERSTEPPVDMTDGKVCGLLDPELVQLVIGDDIGKAKADFVETRKIRNEADHRCIVYDTAQDVHSRIHAAEWDVADRAEQREYRKRLAKSLKQSGCSRPSQRQISGEAVVCSRAAEDPTPDGQSVEVDILFDEDRWVSVSYWSPTQTPQQAREAAVDLAININDNLEATEGTSDN